MDRDALERAADILAGASHAVALTGAGISKASGIPTFRGPDGLWTKRGEPPLNGYQIFLDDPAVWWEQRIGQLDQPDDFRLSLEAAQPTAGHRALAELERLGALHHVITQNVDDLHRRAGTQSLTEIHGNTLVNDPGLGPQVRALLVEFAQQPEVSALRPSIDPGDPPPPETDEPDADEPAAAGAQAADATAGAQAAEAEDVPTPIGY